MDKRSPNPSSPIANDRSLTPGIDRIDAALASNDVEALQHALRELSEEDRELLAEQIGEATVRRAVRSARRGPRSSVPRGRVIVLNGIMGAELARVQPDGGRKLIWVSFWQLLKGAISELALDADGKSLFDIRVAGIRREYAALISQLGEDWEVRAYPYDWRHDIDLSADRLAEVVREFAKGGPAHLVAHSMGGLVARRMIQRHPELWASMDDPEGRRRGGRLVMLGTPNRGAFAVPPIFTGTEKTVSQLALVDVRHDLKELLTTLVTFTGAYQMLPSLQVEHSDDRAMLFEKATWGASPVSQRWLDKAKRFQEELFPVVTPERLVYVAGYDEPTLHRIRIRKPGEFEYQETLAGDGRVPHELGLLKDVATFYVRESHGALPSNDAVLDAIDALIETGTTDQLSTSMGAARRSPPSDAWISATELHARATDELTPVVESLKRRGIGDSDPTASLQIESAVLDTWIGADARRGAAGRPAGRRGPAKRIPRRKLEVQVVWGDVREVEADVFAVGHYAGVLPQFAEKALDEVVSVPDAEYDERVIVKLTRRGAIREEVGDVNLFPRADRLARSGTRTRMVAVVGMGRPGTFGSRALRRLIRQLVWHVSSLPDAKSLGMVLIGSGNGNLDSASALDAIVNGLHDAFDELPEQTALSQLLLVDYDHLKCERIREQLEETLKRDRDGSVQLALTPEVVIHPGAKHTNASALALALAHVAFHPSDPRVSQLAQLVPAKHDARRALVEALEGLRRSGPSPAEIAKHISIHVRSERRSDEPPSRLCYTRDGADLRVSALTNTAVKPERVLSFDRTLLDKLVGKMIDPRLADRPRLSRLLTHLTLPHDFRALLQESASIVFEVDRDTAAVHWEMLTASLEEGASAGLATQVQVARQLRTTYSPPPTRATSSRERLRVLVIGDPGDPREREDLPGARREAIAVWELLAKLPDVEVTAMIGAPSAPRGNLPAGARPAERLDVLAELLEGGYDLVHYCGHGDFDPVDGTRVGWLFEGGDLTSRELALLTAPPRLVVANACLSGQVSRVQARGRAAQSESALLPSLADEFFRRGVRDYVGTAWEVNDDGAVDFARAFYGALLGPNPRPIGAAMLIARKVLAEKEPEYDALWAAYQHYGDPGMLLGRRKLEAEAAEAKPRAAKATRKQRER